METIAPISSQKSGFYYANKFAAIYFSALEQLVGEASFATVLKVADIPYSITNYPPDNLHLQFDFSDFAALNVALEAVFGISEGRNVALRAGQNSFMPGLQAVGQLIGIGRLEHYPVNTKIWSGLARLVTAFRHFSDQETDLIQYDTYRFQYTIKRCPICWGRHDTDAPICHAALGLLQAGLKWATHEIEFQVIETECHAKGDEYCVFEIRNVQ